MEHPQLTQILCAALCVVTISQSSIAIDTLSPNQTLADDGQVLTSPAKIFELGFFSPANNTSTRFLGIWYKATPHVVVWVANRESSMVGLKGHLSLTNNGSLVLSTAESGNTTIWTSSSSKAASSPVVQLFDSGNLVIVDKPAPGSSSKERYVWQSFDHPCDTRLPGMMMAELSYLTSWTSGDDPAMGEFSYGIDNHGLSQVVITKGLERRYRTIFWGGHFAGFPYAPDQDWRTEFTSNRGRLVSVINPYNGSMIIRVTLNHSGSLEGYIMNEQRDGWKLMIASPGDSCESYGRCGAYGICKVY